MDGPKAKLDVISSFILRHLEDTFRQMKLSHPLPETSIEVTTGGIKYDPAVKDRLSAEQWAVLRTRLYQLAVQLPALLFNSGVTDGLLSADKIHITAYKRYVCVQVEGYGLLIVDLEGKKFHARLWESVDNPVNGKPIEMSEVLVSGSTHKRNLNTGFDYTAAIQRDKNYVTTQLKDFLNKEGIPTSKEDLIPGIGIKLNWLKHKELAKKLGPLHEAYKTLLKTPAYKGLINDSPAEAIYNIGTARQGEGNLPGVNAIPGGKQLVDIMANDQFQKDDLLMIDIAQKTSASEKDDWGNSKGGYNRLINALRTYNDNNWGDSFQGIYLHQQELEMIEKMKFIIPKSMHFTTSFAAQPLDTNSKPYEYFMYIRSGQFTSEYLKLNEVGVIYINPAK